MTGGSNISFPGESPQEQQLREEQVQLLRQQRDVLSEQMRQQNLLAPMLFNAAGITPVYGQNPNDPNDLKYVVGFEESPDPLKARQEEVASKLLDRQLAALKGDLPVNPALMRELDTQEAKLNETLRKNLGPGYATSTAGGNKLDQFGRFRSDTLEAARRGDLSLAEQLGLARENANSQNINQLLARATGINNNPLAVAQGFGQAASGYTAPLSQLLAVRQGRMQGTAMREQMNQAETAMWLGFTSDTIGAVASAAGAAASSGKLKKDIVPYDRSEYGRALKKLRDTPITNWRYKWESPERPPHVGPILELSPRELHLGDGIHVDLLGYSGLLHAGLKGLERKVDREVKTLRQLVSKGDD